MLLFDASSLLSDVKESRCNDSRAAVQMGLSLLCGSMVCGNRLQSSVSEALGKNRHCDEHESPGASVL